MRKLQVAMGRLLGFPGLIEEISITPQQIRNSGNFLNLWYDALAYDFRHEVLVSFNPKVKISYEFKEYYPSEIEQRYLTNLIIDVLYEHCLYIAEENTRKLTKDEQSKKAQKEATRLLEAILQD